MKNSFKRWVKSVLRRCHRESFWSGYPKKLSNKSQLDRV